MLIFVVNKTLSMCAFTLEWILLRLSFYSLAKNEQIWFVVYCKGTVELSFVSSLNGFHTSTRSEKEKHSGLGSVKVCDTWTGVIATDGDIRYSLQLDMEVLKQASLFSGQLSAVLWHFQGVRKEKRKKNAPFPCQKAFHVTVHITHQWLHPAGVHRKEIHSST